MAKKQKKTHNKKINRPASSVATKSGNSSLQKTADLHIKKTNSLHQFVNDSVDNSSQKLAVKKLVTLRRCLKDMRNLLTSGYGRDSAKALASSLLEVGVQVGAAFIPVPGFGGMASGAVSITSSNVGIASGMSLASATTRGISELPFEDASKDNFQNIQNSAAFKGGQNNELISKHAALTGTTTKGRAKKMIKGTALGTAYKYGGMARQKVRGSKAGIFRKTMSNAAGVVGGGLAGSAHMAKDILWSKTTKPFAQGIGGLGIKSFGKMGLKSAKNRIAYVSAANKGPILNWLINEGGYTKIQTTMEALSEEAGMTNTNVSNYTNFLRHHQTNAEEQVSKIKIEIDKIKLIAEKKWKKHAPIFKKIKNKRQKH